MNPIITKQDLKDLFSFFSIYDGNKNNKKIAEIHQKCLQLINRDYRTTLVDNSLGEYYLYNYNWLEILHENDVCSTYPNNIIIIQGEKTSHLTYNDPTKIQSLLMDSQYARVRRRAVVPVILLGNCNICRSATLSVDVESIYHIGMAKTKKLFDQTPIISSITNMFAGNNNCSTPPQENSLSPPDRSLVLPFKSRSADSNLLKELGVRTIFDFMVEDTRRLLGFSYCSSEKADQTGNYVKFSVAATPYPGCEFFQSFKNSGHSASDLYYDWSNPINEAQLSIPPNSLDINWSQWKSWPLSYLTENYLRLILHDISSGYSSYITIDHNNIQNTICGSSSIYQPSSDGILVHCISGWDRTTVFICLLRLTLWADGYIHKSLDPIEILYLSVAYDWFLFAHQLPSFIEDQKFCFDSFLDTSPNEVKQDKGGQNIGNINSPKSTATKPEKSKMMKSSTTASKPEEYNKSHDRDSIPSNSNILQHSAPVKTDIPSNDISKSDIGHHILSHSFESSERGRKSSDHLSQSSGERVDIDEPIEKLSSGTNPIPIPSKSDSDSDGLPSSNSNTSLPEPEKMSWEYLELERKRRLSLSESTVETASSIKFSPEKEKILQDNSSEGLSLFVPPSVDNTSLYKSLLSPVSEIQSDRATPISNPSPKIPSRMEKLNLVRSLFMEIYKQTIDIVQNEKVDNVDENIENSSWFPGFFW